MSLDDLMKRFSELLAEEEEEEVEVDWDAVVEKSKDLVSKMTLPAPAVVNDYLNSVARRRLDCVFAHAQRTELLHFLKAA